MRYARASLAGFLSAVFLLAHAGPAFATWVSTADQVCDPGDDPCIIDTQVDVARDAVLDFGTRTVRIVPGGELNVDIYAGTVQCGRFEAAVGQAIAVRARGNVVGTMIGGDFTLEVYRRCDGDGQIRCLENSDCPTSSCSIGDGSVHLDGKIQGSSEMTAEVTIMAAGDVTVDQTINFDGNTYDADGGGIFIDSYMGSVTINERLTTTGGIEGSGGEIAIAAAGDVMVNADCDASGGDLDGGTVDLTAANDIIVASELRTDANGGSGFGSTITLIASRDILINGSNSNNKAIVSADGNHSQEENMGGAGGDIIFTAGRDIAVGDHAIVRSTGAKPNGWGQPLWFSAGGTISVAGQLESRGKGGQSNGGTIYLAASDDVLVGGTATIDISGGQAGLGTLGITAGGDLVMAGDVDGTTGGTNGSISAAVVGAAEFSGAMIFDGSLDVAACTIDITGSAFIKNKEDASSNRLTGREQITIAAGAQLIASGAGSTNELIYRDAALPPLVQGNVNPAPALTVDASLVACPGCGDGVVQAGEQCDDGNETGGDCCSAACQLEADGSSCDDGLFCTVSESCNAGQCGQAASRDCSDSDSQCGQGVCSEAEGQCVADAHDDGTVCDDGLYCSTNDQCVAGQCTSGGARDCSALDTQCTEGQCSEDEDLCSSVARDDGIVCNDGLYCTVTDQCSGGQCGGDPRDCSELDGQCQTGVCSEEADSCASLARDDGTVCDDGLYCSTNDQCVDGQCTGGGPRDCSALDTQCTEGQCSEAENDCISEDLAAGTACDDGLFCTASDACNAGSCTGDGDPCGELAECERHCNEQNDLCLTPAGTACTDDGNACTDDSCDAAGACAHTNNSAPCDDNDACTTADQCAAGQCAGGQAVVCDDGLVCNGLESCDSAAGCVAGQAVLCNDAIDCTLDLCDEQEGGCLYYPDDWACRDDDLCSLDSCSAETGCSHDVAPRNNCAMAAKEMLQVSDKAGGAKDKLKWKWQKGPRVVFAELGRPDVSTAMALCMYDDAEGEAGLAARIDIPTGSGWRAVGAKGFKFKDRGAGGDGVYKVMIKTGPSGKTKAMLAAKGENLPLPGPVSATRYFEMDPKVRAQLINDNGMCWSVELGSARRNTATLFKGKEP